ncbi:sensor histidine kinase [Nocardioides oleivorans]
MRRLLENLIGNALQDSPDGQSVVVHVQARPSFVCLRVRDWGVGIASEDLPRIYEPGFRAKQPGGRGPAGTGLGMSISKQIVQDHGGTIATASRSGSGTEVTVVLPRSTDPNAPSSGADCPLDTDRGHASARQARPRSGSARRATGERQDDDDLDHGDSERAGDVAHSVMRVR